MTTEDRTPSFKVSKADHEVIIRIVDRAAQEHDFLRVMHVDRLTLLMDLTTTHASCPLRLADMWGAPDEDFWHDIAGIVRHIDRKTGELGGCFLPRFAQPERAEVSQ